MKKILCLVAVYLLGCKGASVVLEFKDDIKLNHNPIVGVLSQETVNALEFPEENYTSYIAASYVKDVEASGARVVPIMIGRDRSYYETLLSKLNGVLIPGGVSCFDKSNGYADAGEHIFDIAKKLNEAGDYFPVFGTCLGFELLLVLASGRGEKDIRSECNSHKNLPLDFSKDFNNSKMFSKAPQDLVHTLGQKNVTFNNHHFCITEKNLKSYNLTEDWLPTSYGFDDDGIKFISTCENKRYPIYGVQFHPEKPSFEWKPQPNSLHSLEAIKSNRYFMDFFVNECKRNHHKFSNVQEENEHLIYNYAPIYTGPYNSVFTQSYLFEPRSVTVPKIHSFDELDLTVKTVNC